MLPFKITFCQTVDKRMNIEQIDMFLDISKNVIREKNPDYISKENNHLTFKNNFFRLSSNWNLMSYTDSGFIEVKTKLDGETKITYGLTFVSIWIVSSIFSIIIFLSTKELNFSLIAFSFFGPLTWLISLLRHWWLFLFIKKTYLNETSNNNKD